MGHIVESACSASGFRRYAPKAVAAAGAIVTLGVLTAACGGNQSPPGNTTSTTTTTTSPPVSVSPTPKAIDPSGPNSFTPSVLAPPPQTAQPGVHHNF
ncbi:hypothetical protein LHJ73_22315 [Mycolicibacterium phocaicum]|nr:hypothetical protein LHJ73_22315 [Mycolicibacterium phocaicum]